MLGLLRLTAAAVTVVLATAGGALAANDQLKNAGPRDEWPLGTPAPILSRVSGTVAASVLFRNPSGDPFATDLEQRFALDDLPGARVGLSLKRVGEHVAWLVHESWATSGTQTDSAPIHWDGVDVPGPNRLEWRCDRLEVGVESLHTMPSGPIIKLIAAFETYTMRLEGSSSVQSQIRSEAGAYAGWAWETALGTFIAIGGVSGPLTRQDDRLALVDFVANVFDATGASGSRYSLELRWSPFSWATIGHEWTWTADVLSALEISDPSFGFTITRVRTNVWYAMAAVPLG
jgi:hypothetical protein